MDKMIWGEEKEVMMEGINKVKKEGWKKKK